MESRNPDFWNASSCFCGTGSVKVLLKRIKLAPIMRAFSVLTPFPFIRRKHHQSPGSDQDFFGSHPRSSQVPHGTGRESMIATDQPALRI